MVKRYTILLLTLMLVFGPAMAQKKKRKKDNTEATPVEKKDEKKGVVHNPMKRSLPTRPLLMMGFLKCIK